MDSIGVINYVNLYVQEFVQENPLQVINSSVVLRDGYEFCILDTSGLNWLWYRFREGVILLSMMYSDPHLLLCRLDSESRRGVSHQF